MRPTVPLRSIILREIAHARAGDKDDISNVSLFVFDPAHYPFWSMNNVSNHRDEVVFL